MILFFRLNFPTKKKVSPKIFLLLYGGGSKIASLSCPSKNEIKIVSHSWKADFLPLASLENRDSPLPILDLLLLLPSSIRSDLAGINLFCSLLTLDLLSSSARLFSYGGSL